MYAEVAVNAPVRGTFHYHIPPELDGHIRPGHLVRVGFGTATQHGIVLALLADSPIEQTKPIEERLDPLPVVTQQQIELARWMSEEYLAPLGTCLWLMLPPGLTARDIRLTLIRDDAVGDDPLQKRIIDLLRRRGPLLGQRIQLAVKDREWRKAADALFKTGIVRRESTLAPPRVRPKIVQTAALAIHPDQIPHIARHLGKRSLHADLLEVIAAATSDFTTVDEVLEIAGVSKTVLNRLVADGLVAVQRGGRGEPSTITLEIPPESVEENLIELRDGYVQLRVLERLARESEPMEVSQISDETGAALADLKALEEDGLILLGERQTWRDSLAYRDFVPAVAPKLTPEQHEVWDVIEGAIKGWLWTDPHPASPASEGGVTRARSTPSPLTGRVGEGFKHSESGENWSYWGTPPKLWRKLQPLAKQMRREPTQAEKHLWQELRRHQVSGYKFRRQQAIDRFIVDFFSADARLIVEIDGEIHEYTPEEDAIRQEFLESLGFKVIRFTNDEVFNKLDAVLHKIREALSHSATPVVPEEGLSSRIFLLHGVTGSGKTEIYLRAVELALAQGRQAIFLVPEIALTAQTVRRVAARFPGRVAIVHSRLSPGERYDTWRRAREGLIQVVVGARSALFTPLPDVGLVILDEEHDHSYKQAQSPTGPPYYHARSVAEEMMRLNNGVLILGSATPDVESVFRARRGDIHYVHLPNRIMGHRTRILEQSEREGVSARYYPSSSADALTIDLPPVQVVDMREELKAGNTGIFSRNLHTALATVLERSEQAILLLNRRGQATYVFCRDCGYIAACPRCNTPLTYHRQGEALRCHHCGYQQPAPRKCPSCSSKRIKYFGAGTQQVQAELTRRFPQARVLRWDADTADKPDMHEAILERFITRQADVMVGTQMIAKGLDLPLVTLVGVVSADLGLALPDFRAGERAFQLLTQVAGRAGRGLLGGQVILQTYQPQHYAIEAASKHDYQGFYEQEIAYRRDLGYPPFRRLARIVFRYPSEITARSEAERAADLLRQRIEELKMTGTELIGPAPCFFTRLDRQYRWHLLLRGPDPAAALEDLDVPRGWYLDIDPVDVL